MCVCGTSSTIVNYDWLPTSLWAWCVLWNGIIWGLGDHYWTNTTAVLHCKCGIFVSLAKDFSCCIQLHQSSQSICDLFVFWKLELDGGGQRWRYLCCHYFGRNWGWSRRSWQGLGYHLVCFHGCHTLYLSSPALVAQSCHFNLGVDFILGLS